MTRDPNEFILWLWNHSRPVKMVHHRGLWNTSKGSLWGEAAKSLWVNSENHQLPYGNWMKSHETVFVSFQTFSVQLSIHHTNKINSLCIKKNINATIFASICDLLHYMIIIVHQEAISFLNHLINKCISLIMHRFLLWHIIKIPPNMIFFL